MDSEQRNGYKRRSGRQDSYVQPVERRSSKKSSSQDRHGKIYPDSFRERTIRAVTPDSPSETTTGTPASDVGYGSAGMTSSPRTSNPKKQQERYRDFPPASTAEDESTTDSRDSMSRPRTKTLDDIGSDSSPVSFLSRTRQRLGSNNTGGSAHKPTDDAFGSIGYPSIIQSPTSPDQTSNRQKLVKSPPRILSPSTGPFSKEPAFSAPLMNTDANKILQLMKTTCGRMHGILSFRTATTGNWSSGYCAINVATGSLIYQAKGEPSHVRTLIPDLRGCNVRTHYDPDLPGTYLSVSTHSSGLGIQLRPHVPETFDSWLAALLCWQPIRPKGVQNKMTKPQSISIGERRAPDRRRASESTVQRDAAIIKVGKMLLLDKHASKGPASHPTTRRVSTYKQQRALSSAWQKVSCTLQENGHFKLFTESDVTLVTCIPLSQLSRCAIQQLEPSVLEDEFCIALYPQYTVHAGSQLLHRPIFLSLESRVLFEVWFVLLRAFTIPELYGPEQLVANEEKGQENGSMSAATGTASVDDMFRVERLLSVRITEAKLISPREPEPGRGKSKGRAHIPMAINHMVGDFYAELFLDGEMRAKTAVKSDTSTPFWREEFSFCDLPPVLSSASVLVKTRNTAQKDWTLVAHGPYALGHGDSSPMTVLGDLEVSSNDFTYGRVDLRLDDLDRGVEIEKWWLIQDDNEKTVGEMLMKVRLEETVILMAQDYAPMSHLLHAFSNGLTIQIAQSIPGELKRLSETLLNIFQVSAQTGDWIMALVEDEIDGLQRESSASRLRYSNRIQSNDSHESGPEREVLVRDLGRSATVEANLLFRGNSLLTKALDMHMRRLGKEYLEETLGERLRDIDESDPECEVDPNKVHNPEDLNRNWRNLVALTSTVWKAISASASRCPPELRQIFRHIRACAEDRYGDFLRTVAYSSVSGFLFLRFFCPAILNPSLFGLLKDHPRPRAQRTLTLIAKSLQGLANMSSFGSKEPWMEPMNKFLLSHRNEFKTFVDQICSIPAERSTQAVSPSYATPIQILSRLPPTSREGFPSLPFLIDSARNFAALIGLWLEAGSDRVKDQKDVNPNLAKFDAMCHELHQRTKDCLSKAEQAERPSGNLEVKWEELVEQIERSSTFYEDASKPTTPSAETAIRGFNRSKRNSVGFFASLASPMPMDPSQEADEERPHSAASATGEHSQPSYSQQQRTETRGSGASSKASSTVSVDRSDPPRARQSQVIREASGKYRFFDFVGGSTRRKGKEKEKDGTTTPREEVRNEI